MDSRRLTVALLLIVAVSIAFATAPVLSGEHPWNSDRSSGGSSGTGSSGGTSVTYDTITVPSTTVVSGTLVSSSNGISVWVVVLTAVWSASWTL